MATQRDLVTTQRDLMSYQRDLMAKQRDFIVNQRVKKHVFIASAVCRPVVIYEGNNHSHVSNQEDIV